MNSGRVVGGGKVGMSKLKKGSLNASKGAITPSQNINLVPSDISNVFIESLHPDLSVSNLDLLTDNNNINVNPSHRISRQGLYPKSKLTAMGTLQNKQES
jgi:hypothetical protein